VSLWLRYIVGPRLEEFVARVFDGAGEGGLAFYAGSFIGGLLYALAIAPESDRWRELVWRRWIL
jgi:hypothetical protein